MNRYERMARDTAKRHGINPNLFAALVKQESGFNPSAGSPAGARGLTQLMPATARGLGVRDILDPQENLDGGARYLKQQLTTFGGDARKALAAYNAGPGAVQKYGGVPPYAETQNYVRTILGNRNPHADPEAPQTRTRPGSRTTTTTGDPITLHGIGGDSSAPSKLDVVMDLLNGKGGPLEFAKGIRAAEAAEPQDITLPGAETTTTTETGGGDTSSPSSPNHQPHLSGGLSKLADEGLRIARRAGYTGHSGQRSDSQNAAVGGATDSDHLMRPGRIAYDIPLTGESKLMALGSRIAKRYGIPETKPGFWQGEIKSGKKRYRVQVIAGAANDHGDHVHQGIRQL